MTVISVVMSAYNAENFIKEAIESILSQTFADFEFIIINDASTDLTESIVKSFNDSRIKLINNIENFGLTKSLNTGFDLAKGKYILRMDADDISLPERFKKQFDFMEQNPDVNVCGSWYELFGLKNEIVNLPEKNQDIKEELVFNNCIAHPTVIIRKESFDRLNIKYDENLRAAQDYELWCREIDRLKYANIPEILLKYRIHDTQTGFAKKKEQDDTADKVRIRNIYERGVFLANKEQNIYLNILKHKYYFDSTEDSVLACEILEKIRIAGLECGYGSKFEEIITRHLLNISETGIKSGRTSIKLFEIFLKNGVFATNRAKLRYLYHSMRNTFNV